MFAVVAQDAPAYAAYPIAKLSIFAYSPSYMLESAAIASILSPYISELLTPIAQNIGTRVGETLADKSAKWLDYLIPEPKLAEYAARKADRDNELQTLTDAQVERRLQLLEQELRDRRELSALQRNLMRELQAQKIKVKLIEIQNNWDKDHWFSKLNRQETEQILQQQQHRLLLLLSPPEISADCPPSFRNNLKTEMRNIGTFLSNHYPPQDSMRPVKFYSGYFNQPIEDIDVERLHRILAPVPTAIFYCDINDYACTFRIGFWGLDYSEPFLFSTNAWNWEKVKKALISVGEDETEVLRLIRHLIVTINKLLAAFMGDLYYLNIDPNYEPQLFNLMSEFVKEGLVQEWVKPYIEILKDIQQQRREVYERELKRLADQAGAEHERRDREQGTLRKAEKWKCVHTLAKHSKSVNSVAISLDGQTLASGDDDRTIKLWNLKTGQEIRSLTGHTLAIMSLAISADGQTLASGSNDKTIKLWSLRTGQEIYTLTGHSFGVTSVAISADGQTLASGSNDSTIKLWNLKTGQEIWAFAGHSSMVMSVALSTDGQILATGSIDKTIKLWSLKTGKKIYTLTGHSNIVRAVAISPDGQTLASGNDDKTIKLWNLKTGQEICTLTGHLERITGVCFSSDRQTLASSSIDKTIKLWNLKTGQEIRTLTGHSAGISSVTFSSDEQTLVSGSHDRTIKIWQCD